MSIDINSLKPTGNSSGVGMFIGKLFYSRTETHIAHLQTKSGCEHHALEHYYTCLTELADKLAECYQGCYGIIPNYRVEAVIKSPNALECLKELKNYIIKERNTCFKETFLLSITDDILSLISRTIYKLENLCKP
jgi:hypothetical protein